MKYIEPLAKKYGFNLVKEEAYGMGALKDYVAGNLYIRLVNDKGIISFEIAPGHLQNELRDVALYKELLAPPPQGVWNLSLAEQAEFLDCNWEWFNTNLSDQTAEQTLKNIDACATRQRKILLGDNT